MKRKTFFLCICIIFVVAVGIIFNYLYNENFSLNVNSNVNNNTNDKKDIVLEFIPQPIKELEDVYIDGHWNHKASEIIDFNLKKEGISIQIYEVKKDENLVVLDDYDGFYNMDISLMEEEIDRLIIMTEDMNSNGIEELVLIIDRGATVKDVNVYTYENSKWQCILTAENLISTDLSEDGTSELITTSMGTLPPYIYIYRWNGNSFEKADINKETGFLYSTLICINEKTYIEAGNPDEPHFFKYKQGKLLECKID